MTLYEKFKEMNNRHFAIGLEQSNTDVTYYCICFEWNVREGCTGMMDAVTITALYSNLLSNAVEAAGQSKEKKIEFSAIYKPEQKSIVISVVNSCDLPPIPDGKGFFRSTKNTSQFHGVGMKSIARVLEKHHGISTHYYDNVHKRFHYLIQIPF